jgi:hypothetical protein
VSHNTLQIEILQRRKQRSLALLVTAVIALVVTCLLRFVPRWNDSLAGRPQYAKAMTTLMTEEFANVAQNRFPVILLGEDDHCDAVPSDQISDDQVARVLYILTYSEQQHFSCFTTYAVPVDASKFANLRTIHTEEGWTPGPKLLHPINVLPIARTLHVYSMAYLELLHWRKMPQFPISEAQTAVLAGRQYQSTNSSVPADERANIHLDFEKARTLVRQQHDKIDSWLSLALACLGFVALCCAFALTYLYRQFTRYLREYGESLAFSNFLRPDMNLRASVARAKYLEQEHQRQAQQRRQAMEASLRQDLEEKLHFALGNLHDENLRKRVEEGLQAEPHDLDAMRQFVEEVQEAAGHKTPEEKLALLLESITPYCTEDELNACREEALRIFTNSGFREARNYAVATHDQFRLRMKQIEEREYRS